MRYLIDVEYWEYEQALELPYGYVIAPADVPIGECRSFVPQSNGVLDVEFHIEESRPMSATCPAAEDKRHYWYLDVCQSCGASLTVTTASSYVTGDEDDHEDGE